LRDALEGLVKLWCRRKQLGDDPLSIVYDYADEADREVVAAIASSLAFGRVDKIDSAVRWVLRRMGEHPRDFLLARSSKRFRRFAGFRYRFVSGGNLKAFLEALAAALRKNDSLQSTYRSVYKKGRPKESLTAFVNLLRREGRQGEVGYLLADPSRGSACKRLNLFLRWMVRRDGLDLGLWRGISPSDLIIPLDVHIGRVSRRLGFTERRTNGWKTAVEITESLRRFSPTDPTRYDFALMKLGKDGPCGLEPDCSYCSLRHYCPGVR